MPKGDEKQELLKLKGSCEPAHGQIGLIQIINCLTGIKGKRA